MMASSKSSSTLSPEPADLSLKRQFAPFVVVLLAVGLSQLQEHYHHAIRKTPAGEQHYFPIVDWLRLPPAETKPYATFTEFYPHYLREHSKQSTKRLHFVGTSLIIAAMLMYPGLLYAAGSAGTALLGYTLFPYLRWLSTGVPEGAIVLGTFLVVAWMRTGSWKLAVLIPLCGYGFAWVGHFFFEQNKPATFIYPTFSLFGDFTMWYQMLTKSNGLHI